MYYSEAEARELVIKAGIELVEHKLVARTWGNISARISEDEFIITPSGKAYERLREEDLARVRVSDAASLDDINPSSEKGAHAVAYRLKSEIDFIIHTHQYYASCVAAECKDRHFAACVDYALPGSERLVRNIEKSMLANPDCDEFLLARHGVLVMGDSYDDAFDRAAYFEEESKALVESRTRAVDSEAPEDFDVSEVNIKAMPYIRIARDPYIMECCRAGKRVGAYVDDFAQIVGPDIQVVDNDPWMAKRAILGYSTTKPVKGPIMLPKTGVLGKMGGEHETLNDFIGRNAVLVKGVGAVCAGKTEADAEALEMIVSKNCAAACYVRNAKPLSKLDARILRHVYLLKYCKHIHS